MLGLLTGSSMVGLDILIAVAIALTGCAATTTAATSASSPNVAESNRTLVQAAFDRWRAGTGNPFELLRPDAEWTIVGSSPLSKTYRTKQQFLDEVITPFNARVQSGLVPTVHGLYADGDTVVILFDGETIANDGLPYVNTYTWYFRMKNGEAVSATAFFDTRLFDDLWNRVTPKG